MYVNANQQNFASATCRRPPDANRRIDSQPQQTERVESTAETSPMAVRVAPGLTEVVRHRETTLPTSHTSFPTYNVDSKQANARACYACDERYFR